MFSNPRTCQSAGILEPLRLTANTTTCFKLPLAAADACPLFENHQIRKSLFWNFNPTSSPQSCSFSNTIFAKRIPVPFLFFSFFFFKHIGSQCDCATFMQTFQTTKYFLLGPFLAPLRHLLLLAFLPQSYRRAPKFAIKKQNQFSARGFLTCTPPGPSWTPAWLSLIWAFRSLPMQTVMLLGTSMGQQSASSCSRLGFVPWILNIPATCKLNVRDRSVEIFFCVATLK